MNRLALAFLFAATLAAGAFAQVDWRTNLADAKAEAARLKKPLLVYFTTDWCGWCKIT